MSDTPPADRAAVLAEVEQHLRRLARHIEDGCDFCNGVDWAADQVAKLTATRPDTTGGRT